MRNMVKKAMDFAIIAHHGQLDDEGRDYFMAHVGPVFKAVELFTKDEDILTASLLHDTVEDCGVTYETLVKTFSVRVADLVMEVTHDGTKDKGYYFPRLHTKEGILIKLADRMSNVSRMDSWDKPRQEQYLKKTKFWKSSKDEK
jgi:(p)ppGpp synthase/HD superfamily hydrolase